MIAKHYTNAKTSINKQIVKYLCPIWCALFQECTQAFLSLGCGTQLGKMLCSLLREIFRNGTFAYPSNKLFCRVQRLWTILQYQLCNRHSGTQESLIFSYLMNQADSESHIGIETLTCQKVIMGRAFTDGRNHIGTNHGWRNADFHLRKSKARIFTCNGNICGSQESQTAPQGRAMSQHKGWLGKG